MKRYHLLVAILAAMAAVIFNCTQNPNDGSAGVTDPTSTPNPALTSTSSNQTATCSAQSGAAAVNTLGFGGFGDATYSLSFEFSHAGGNLVLSFSGSLTESSGPGDTGDESWGLDNVAVNGYAENFNDGSAGAEWSKPSVATSPSGERFLGEFGSETVTLTLNLPSGNVKVSFDLYILKSWDGEDLTGGGFGPDIWSLRANSSTLLSASFSNVHGADHPQTFCPREGCTPGFWKNHEAAWGPTGFSTGQYINTVFAIPGCLSTCSPALANTTLLNALSFGGGSGICGGAKILLRAAVAALLNAAHPEVSYPWTTSQVINEVNNALASCNRSTMISLADKLDADNNLGSRLCQ
jgi:hypothetical protein